MCYDEFDPIGVSCDSTLRSRPTVLETGRFDEILLRLEDEMLSRSPNRFHYDN